jgi:sugar phosphate isomerase/epimerase
VSTFRIAIQLASLRSPFKQALLTAGSLGATSVEIDARTELRPEELSTTGLRQVRKMLDDSGLRVASVRFATRRGYHVLDELDRRVAATKAAMKMAYELRAPYVVNSVGRVPADAADPAFGILVEVLGDLGRFGARTGALLAARTGLEDGPTLAKLMAALDEGSIRVDFDPAGLIEGGFSVDEAVRALGPYTGLVRARDAVRDRAQGRAVEVQLGRGSVDFPALFGALEDFAFRGDAVIERNLSDDPQHEIGQALAYLKELSAA